MILYYLLGALITSLGFLEYCRFVDRDIPEHLTSDDWKILALVVLIWPIVWVGCLFGLLPKALVKERDWFKQPENDNDYRHRRTDRSSP